MHWVNVYTFYSNLIKQKRLKKFYGSGTPYPYEYDFRGAFDKLNNKNVSTRNLKKHEQCEKTQILHLM